MQDILNMSILWYILTYMQKSTSTFCIFKMLTYRMQKILNMNIFVIIF